MREETSPVVDCQKMTSMEHEAIKFAAPTTSQDLDLEEGEVSLRVRSDGREMIGHVISCLCDVAASN